jgi:co-chaperonin GroES (HSP10)
VTQSGIIIQTKAQDKGNIVEVVKVSEEEAEDIVEGDLYYCSQEFSDPVELTGEKLYFVDPSYLLAKLIKSGSKK